eukprot:12161337-Alexandrium_andersonii.AAC.1
MSEKRQAERAVSLCAIRMVRQHCWSSVARAKYKLGRWSKRGFKKSGFRNVAIWKRHSSGPPMPL